MAVTLVAMVAATAATAAMMAAVAGTAVTTEKKAVATTAVGGYNSGGGEW
jgi:hypothetical protein